MIIIKIVIFVPSYFKKLFILSKFQKIIVNNYRELNSVMIKHICFIFVSIKQVNSDNNERLT